MGVMVCDIEIGAYIVSAIVDLNLWVVFISRKGVESYGELGAQAIKDHTRCSVGAMFCDVEIRAYSVCNRQPLSRLYYGKGGRVTWYLW